MTKEQVRALQVARNVVKRVMWREYLRQVLRNTK